MGKAGNIQNKTNQKSPPTKPTVAKCTKDCQSVALHHFHGKLEVGKEPGLRLCHCQIWGLNTKNLLPLWVPGRERKIEQVAENLEPEGYTAL